MSVDPAADDITKVPPGEYGDVSLRSFVKVQGTILAFTLAIFLCFFLLLVYSSGGRAMIDMTQYAEQHIEALLLTVVSSVLSVAFYLQLEDGI